MGMVATIPLTPTDFFLISTAPEGFFKGYSTVISFKAASGQHVIAKAMLNPALTSKVRREIHSLLAEHFDALLSTGIDAMSAVREVLSAAKTANSVVDFALAGG